MKSRSLVPAILVATQVLSGCTVGPNYRRPAAEHPAEFRGSAGPASPAEVASLAEQKWWEVFQDEQLQALIRTALQQNYDLRIAATRILQAEAQLGITRADQVPAVDAGADITSQRNPRTGPIPGFQRTAGRVQLAAGWQLDFWGKYRRATEAARAELLATEWAQRAVISTLVADVASGYLQLRELDLELEISKRTLASRQKSMELTQTLQERGLNSLLDVRQAEQLVYTASARIPDLERRIEQQENGLRLLVGEYPGAVSRGLPLTAQPRAPQVPAGLPSSLLERRPDIQQVEQLLIAANARIGVARAAYFPQISLTASGGLQSATLTELFNGPAGFWSLAGELSQPIFAGGRIKAGIKLSEAQQQETLLAYQRAIRRAFREVSDALVAYRKIQESRAQQELLARAAQDAARLSDLRYRAGETNYLEVLTNETNVFDAELQLAQAQVNELLALVQLYRALGGGWDT